MVVEKVSRGLKSTDFGEIIEIPKLNLESIEFALPPSKSHMIRLLALASLDSSSTIIRVNQAIGYDTISMIECLGSLGVEIIQNEENDWIVSGVGHKGFTSVKPTVNCGNSGTAMRILMAMIATMNQTIILEGDQSLSMRENSALKDSLKSVGVSIIETTSNHLPVKITGPWFADESIITKINLDLTKSSQPLTAWLLASSLLGQKVILSPSKSTVSNRHHTLTLRLCNEFGANIKRIEGQYHLTNWQVKTPEEILVPGDSSIASFAILLTKLHQNKINLLHWPEDQDCLGNEILKHNSDNLGIVWQANEINSISNGSIANYDLTDCNDLITPLSIILAISSGGSLSGISHTKYKESDRISKTISLMEDFGLYASYDGEIMTIPGGQVPIKPTLPVSSHNDHRIFMTAVVLMTKFGGEVIGNGLHNIADPMFLDRLGIVE
jgi:3-phosphoshikimate 1-carboxyvinyltransferase